MKYTLHDGKVIFDCFMAKEIWLTKSNISSLEFVFNQNKNTMGESEKDILNDVIKTMKKSLKRMEKENNKDREKAKEIFTC